MTVFAGAPSIQRYDGWNYVTTGEASAHRAIQRRRSEDAAAMAVLGASPYWIDLWDSQYVEGRGQDVELVQASIRDVLERIRPRSVIVPIGIHHPDHLAVADACLDLAGASELSTPALSWYGYLDMPYAQSYPDEVAPRLAAVLARANLELVQCEPFRPSTDVKERVAGLYCSQRDHVRGDHPGFEQSMTDPERFWAIERAS